MTDEKLKRINDLRHELENVKLSLRVWKEGKAYEGSAYTKMASFLYGEEALFNEIDERITTYFEGKIDKLQKAYDTI